VIRRYAPKAPDFVNRRCRHRGVVEAVERVKNRTKSKVRAKVEHPIRIIERVFGFAQGALANLFMAPWHLLGCQGA
jgi:IS5 family transposase